MSSPAEPSQPQAPLPPPIRHGLSSLTHFHPSAPKLLMFEPTNTRPPLRHRAGSFDPGPVPTPMNLPKLTLPPVVTALPFAPTATRPPLRNQPSQYVPRPYVAPAPRVKLEPPPVVETPVPAAPKSQIAPATPVPPTTKPIVVPLPADWHPNLKGPGRNVAAWGVVFLFTTTALAVARFVALPAKVGLAMSVGGMALVAFGAISLLVLGARIVSGAKRISGE